MPRFGNRRRVRRERLYSSYGYSSYRHGSILSIFERYGHRRYTSSSFISYGPPRRRPFGYERDCRWRERYYERENRKKELEEKEEERLEKIRKRREEKEKKRKERQRQKEKEEREKAKEEDRKELERLEKEREEKEKKDKRERERLAEERRKQKERREREKREEAERIRKAKEERLRKEKEEKERAAREAKEREAKRVLEVKEVNLRIGENAKRHHTDKFRLTQDKDAELVVRRGQLFVMDITFDRPYNIEYHDLSLIFCIGDKPNKLRGTKFEILLDEEGNQSASPEEWYARLIHRHENSITVEVRTACDCIIGEWSLHISTSGKDKEGRETRDLYEHPDDINILFNPWCKDDRVYMADESLLEEYILNDQGTIFAGSHNGMFAKLWNFGQFDDGILEICFTLLRKGNGWEFSKKLGDPIAISRMLSHLINYSGYYGDEGVLIGNWSGDYSDGTSPTFWTGSADILKQYDENNGEMVKYGQCWVFSGVTTTVCRALGLPCKSVTCFNSAHDTDQSTTRDIVYKIIDGKLEKDSELSRDSVWNFHVWNEVFMKRPDLIDDKFNGWQVIDATPQEESEGMFVCGPASVRAIKDGLVSRPHEAKFIFAEVNSDVITWHVDGNQWTKESVNTTDVGKRIMSKNPDGKPYEGPITLYSYMLRNSPHDVTRHYKYPEGSTEERIAVRKAGNASTIHRARGDYTPPPKHLEVYMDECDSVSTGEDFILIFHLKNISNEAVEVCKTNAKLYTRKYTGDINALVLDSDFQDMKIEPQKEVKVEIECKANVYLPKIVEQGNMEMILTAKVANIEEYIMKSEKFRLRRPDIDVECASKGKLGEKCKVKMSFKNHMPVPLTKCKLIVDGAGFFTENRKEPDVKPGGIWEETIELTPKRKGKNQIIASFDCVELPDITGKADVFIY